ncbi:DUF6510 family protein [Glaciibacter flavus]|uniref:DUF6510 family protein n=1 Tax=Orlajensenia flava TaxID=2565934 RepID=UPI003B00DADE
MSHLDGNALAGVLSEVFTFDPTLARARCANCYSVDVLARAMVYVDGSAFVVRCASCDAVLATVMDGAGRRWVSLKGVSAIEIPR